MTFLDSAPGDAFHSEATGSMLYLTFSMQKLPNFGFYIQLFQACPVVFLILCAITLHCCFLSLGLKT